MERFCVVVPAHNEEVVIEDTLRHLMAGGARPEDIYVVDDYSKDATGDIARSLGVHVLRNDPNLGKALAIQRVVEHFRLTEQYEFIGLMDADTQVDIHYFSEMLKSFEKPEVVAVCGRPISLAHNWLTAYRALCYANGHYVYRKAQGKIGMICIAPGCSTMYRSSVFNKLEWKNDTSAEDMYVTIQIYHQHLGEVAYATKAKVYTQTPRTLSAYIKQMDRWYGGTWQVIRKMRVFFGKLKVDWECKLLWTEGFIMAFIRMLSPFVALATPFIAEQSVGFPWWIRWATVWLKDIPWISDVPWYLGSINALAALVVGSYLAAVPAMCVFAFLERRWDILRYSPLYPLMWYIDVFIFIKAFCLAIILNKPIKWITPPRYVEKGKHT